MPAALISHATRARQTAGRADPSRSAPLHAKPFVEINYRNLESVVLQVYRVDLMKLALIEKNLTQINAVNLAGIKPLLTETVKLGDGLDYVYKTVRVALTPTADGTLQFALFTYKGSGSAVLYIDLGEISSVTESDIQNVGSTFDQIHRIHFSKTDTFSRLREPRGQCTNLAQPHRGCKEPRQQSSSTQ